MSFLFYFTTCLTTKTEKSLTTPSIIDNPTSMSPPNAIKINDSLFVDWTEVSNINWKEYNMYNLRIYGEQSLQYIESLPYLLGYVRALDENNELKVESDVTRDFYYHEAEYDDYPITGITLEQAKNFSKWRSDRVFEGFLIKAGIINNNGVHFTIQEFLETDIYKENADKITHYPEYFIPTVEHVRIVQKLIKDEEKKLGIVHTVNNAKREQRYFGLPIKPVGPLKGIESKNILYNIGGNVYELVDGKNKIYGGSFLNTKEEILDLPIQTAIIPNEIVGFRNYCRWVEIKR